MSWLAKFAKSLKTKQPEPPKSAPLTGLPSPRGYKKGSVISWNGRRYVHNGIGWLESRE